MLRKQLSFAKPVINQCGIIQSLRNANFWLRHETKLNEHRTPILPSQIKHFRDHGHTVTVEKSPVRCFPDAAYAAEGCQLVETGSWACAPESSIIVGLKELPESDAPIKHNHIYFAHCYKEQDGWQDILKRFQKGNGKIWDMEFLTFDNGERVAAFGKSAGYAGTAVGIQAWAHQISDDEPLSKLYPQDDFETLAKYSARVVEKRLGDKKPRILVIGGNGRCGKGAVAAAQDIGVPDELIDSWGSSDTKSGGPFPEILDYDILVNCIYLRDNIPPFLDQETVEEHADSKNLSVLVDVSCDYNNPANPLPLYDQSTTFDKPTLPVDNGIEVVAIDHLPTLVPTSSSEEFSSALLPHLLRFGETPVWHRAEALFEEMVEKV